MPWCPKCGLEYREGFEKCSECNEALTDVPPEKPVDTDKQVEFDDVGAFLISVSDGFEAEIVEAKLEAYGIPVLKKHKSSGDYLNIYMGISPLGIDLYVPSKLLDKAREVIEAVPEVEDYDEDEIGQDTVEEELQREAGEEPEMEEASGEHKLSRLWLLLLLGIPVVIYLIISLMPGK